MRTDKVFIAELCCLMCSGAILGMDMSWNEQFIGQACGGFVFACRLLVGFLSRWGENLPNAAQGLAAACWLSRGIQLQGRPFLATLVFLHNSTGLFWCRCMIYGTDELRVLLDSPRRVGAHGAAGVRRRGG